MITTFSTFPVPLEAPDTLFNILVADSDSMQTPKALLLDILCHFGGFNLDVASNGFNSTTTVFKMDGLKDDWISYNGDDKPILGRVWCNPPYSKGIQAWLEKAQKEVHELRNAELAVILCQFDPSTAAFAYAQQYADEIIILTDRRIKFIGRYCKLGHDASKYDIDIVNNAVVISKQKPCEFKHNCDTCPHLSKNSSSRQPHCLIVFRGVQ